MLSGMLVGDLALALASTLADCLAEIGQPPIHETSSTADNGGNKYKQMFRLRSLHLLAFFALLYVGVEVTLGGTLPRPFDARKRTILTMRTTPCRLDCRVYPETPWRWS